jgi:hypothetical protein
MAKSLEALKVAREKRIAARSGTASPQVGTDVPSPTPSKVQSDTASSAKVAPTVTNNRVVTAAVADPLTASANADVSFVLFGEKTENPHWVGLIEGEPAFKIALANQPEESREKLAPLFVTHKYPESLRSGIAKVGLAKVLADVNAQVYAASISETDLAKKIRSEVEAEKTLEYQRRNAAYVDELQNLVSLVLLADKKNFHSENVLKSAFYTVLKEAGVENPLPLIEEAMLQGMEPHLTSVLKRAVRYSGYTPEALADIKAEIVGMSHRMPVLVEAEVDDPSVNSQREGSIPTARGNVPLTSQRSAAITPSGGDNDIKERVRSVFSFGSRMTNQQMRRR